ncbi:hypothetical protein LTR27_010917 [Elasticomyces elasticus]|nr:hypothetical protein LTR27_010917 [Elasticomyces elasticus]
MSATAATTTAIPLNTLPPAQPGGLAAVQPANNAVPVATGNPPGPHPTGNVPATTPHAPGPRKSIVPNFKASTWLGMALAAAAIAVTVYYGQVMLRLARWSAGNDFRGSCVDGRSIGISSSACNSTLSEPARPPPVLRERDLLVVKTYPEITDIVAVIIVLVTFGTILLVGCAILFYKYQNARRTVVSLARTNVMSTYETRSHTTAVELSSALHRRKAKTIEGWNDHGFEEIMGPHRLGDNRSSGDETVVDDDFDLHTNHEDDASLYMIVRDVYHLDSNIDDLEVNSTTRMNTMADDFDSDEFRDLMRSKVAPEPLERMDSSKAVYDPSLNKISSLPLYAADTNPDVPSQFPRWCRAQYSWPGETKNDLCFQKGDLIHAINAGDGLWWEGTHLLARCFTGRFPSNFVEVLEESFRPRDLEDAPFVPSALLDELPFPPSALEARLDAGLSGKDFQPPHLGIDLFEDRMPSTIR